VSDDELADRYAGAVATVQASPDEGFGLQALEAMACGSLVISTPAEAVREVVGEGVVLWAEPEFEAIADALRAASDGVDLSVRATTVNRQRAEHFSWGRAARSLHALLTAH
jgi:glycosyltransferase involved in cell wall biosynthesis